MRKALSGERSAAPVPASTARPADPKRRRFLFTLGASGAGAAIAVAGTMPATAQIAIAPPTDEDSGYRETAHVRDYYRTAKI